MSDFDISLDLESCAVVDLRRTGVYRYAEDEQTHVICGCFAPHSSLENTVYTWQPGEPPPRAIVACVENGGTIHAWNAQFEAAMWYAILGPRHGWPLPEPEQWDCTMARAMYWGWPGSLELAADAMGLPVQKDKEGHALMLRMARPRAYNDDGTPRWWHLEDKVKLDREIAYCKTDVLTEMEAGRRLPPLPPTERKLWLLDQKMNRKGLPVDMALVETMQRVAKDAEREIKRAISQLTGGKVTG